MSVKADQLRYAPNRASPLECIVTDQLRLLDEKLQRSDQVWGRNVVQHELPVHMPIAGLDKKDVQLLVYSAVVQSLRDRGFEVKILLEPARTVLYVAWVAGIDPAEVDAMGSIIRACRIERADVDRFVRAGELVGGRPPESGRPDSGRPPESGRTASGRPASGRPDGETTDGHERLATSFRRR